MKRKILALCLALILAIGVLPATGLAAHVVSVRTPNSGGTLNLRSGESTSYSSKGYVKDGAAVTINYINEIWANVTVHSSGKTGFIKNKYIVYSGFSGAYVDMGGSGSLNIRASASKTSKSLGYVSHGDKVTVHVLDDLWSKISYGGVTGYLKTKYLRVGASTKCTIMVDGQGKGTDSGSGSSGGGITLNTYDVAEIYSKNGGSVQLRSGAGTGYKSVAALSKGTLLKIPGHTGDWWEVLTFGGLKGYVYKNYVSFGVTCYTNAKVNLRSNAGTGYPVKTTLAKGTRITVHSVDGKWARVTTGSYSGYVYLSYIIF